MDEIGYKKPPKHTRFKKGKSGNSKGRPKKSKNMNTVIGELLDKPVLITLDGNQRTVTGREAVSIRIFQKALNGDPKAIEILRKTDLDLFSKNEQIEEKDKENLHSSQVDREIIESFLNMRGDHPQ